MPKTDILKDYYGLSATERAKIDISKFSILQDFEQLPTTEKTKVAQVVGFTFDFMPLSPTAEPFITEDITGLPERTPKKSETLRLQQELAKTKLENEVLKLPPDEQAKYLQGLKVSIGDLTGIRPSPVVYPGHTPLIPTGMGYPETPKAEPSKISLKIPETDIFKQYPKLAELPKPEQRFYSEFKSAHGYAPDEVLSEKDKIIVEKQKSLFNKVPSTFDTISDTLVATTKDLFNVKQGFRDIAHTIKVGSAFGDAVIGTFNPLLSSEDKKLYWRQVPKVDETNPEAIDRVSSAIATLGLIYGGYQGIKAVPELWNWAKYEGTTLKNNILVKERGLTTISDKKLLEIYKGLPQELKVLTVRNNLRLQRDRKSVV